MNDTELRTQLDAYLGRFATFAVTPGAVAFPRARGRNSTCWPPSHSLR